MKKHHVTLLALGLAMGVTTSAAAQDYENTGAPQPNEGTYAGYDSDAPGPDTGPDRLEFSQRGITLPSGTLRVDGTFGATNSDLGLFGSGTATFLSLGAAFGVMDNLELGLSGVRQGSMDTGVDSGAVPFQLSEDFNFGFVTPYARYRILHNEMLQLAAELTVILPTASHSDFGLMFGAPLRLMLAQMIAIDTGIFFAATFADSTITDLIIPVGLVINVLPALFLLARSRFIYADFDDRFLAIHFGGGYTIEGSDQQPMLDLVATFGFPFFLVNGDTFTDLWEFNFGARFRLGT